MAAKQFLKRSTKPEEVKQDLIVAQGCLINLQGYRIKPHGQLVLVS